MRIAEFSVKGYFWLPETPEARIPGILSVSDGGHVKLETIGIIAPIKTLFGHGLKYERIAGEVETYGYVTLEACYCTTGTSPFAARIPAATYQSHVAFLGVAYEASEKPLFDSLEFHIEGLDEWHGISGIKADFPDKVKGTTITYTPVENIKLWASEDFVLTLKFSWTAPGHSKGADATIRQESYLQIASAEQRPLDDFLLVAGNIRNLLCFAVDENVSMHDIEARSSSILTTTTADEKRQQEIKIIFESIRFEKTIPKIKQHRLIFRFGLIAARSQIVVEAWIKLLGKTNPAMNLFLSARAGEIAYLNFRFLSLVQALETYHQRSLVIYANRPSQRARLTEMFAKFGKHFGSEDARAGLVSLTVDTRNYFTHYDRDLEEKAADGQSLWELYCKLEVLFQLHLLKDMGFDEATIDALVENNGDMRQKLAATVVMSGQNSPAS